MGRASSCLLVLLGALCLGAQALERPSNGRKLQQSVYWSNTNPIAAKYWCGETNFADPYDPSGAAWLPIKNTTQPGGIMSMGDKGITFTDSINQGNKLQPIYQTHCVGTIVELGIPVPLPGKYLVTLLLSENWFNARGSRKFDVVAASKLVAEDLDVFDLAGQRLSAYNVSFVTSSVASEGKNMVMLSLRASLNQAMLSGVIVRRTQKLVEPDAEPGVGYYCAGGNNSISFIAKETPRIMWNPLDPTIYKKTPQLTTFTDPIANTQGLNRVYANQCSGENKLTIPVPKPGKYNVYIHFFESFFNEANKRQFNVLINGVTVFTNLDVLGRWGKIAAYSQHLGISTTTSNITVEFVKGDKDQPIFSGVSVVPVASGPPAPPCQRFDAPQSVYRVYCGDDSFVDSSGNTWESNKSPVLAGRVAAQNTLQPVVGVPREMQRVYQSECTWSGNKTLNLPVPGPGRYQVEILNMEPWFNTTGQRLFTVEIQDQDVAKNIDLFGLSGGRYIAINTTLRATVWSGNSISVTFAPSANGGRISGIIVTYIPFGYRQYCGDRMLYSDIGTWMDMANGPKFSAPVQQGMAYETIYNSDSTTAQPQAVYKSQCFSSEMDMRIPVWPGTYDVTIKNTEVWVKNIGERVFNVSAQGVTMLTDYDILARTRGQQAIAVDETFEVTVAGTTLNLLFSASVENARYSGIVVAPKPFSYRLVCSQDPITDKYGKVWYSEPISSSSRFLIKSQTTPSVPSGSNVPSAIYGSECLPGSGRMELYIPVPRPDTYQVTIYQNEPWCDGDRCSRKFNITAEEGEASALVISDVDVFARAGGVDKGVDITFTVKVTDGMLHLAFDEINGFNVPRFSAVQVTSKGWSTCSSNTYA